jgi:predicted RNase H-like nuclease
MKIVRVSGAWTSQVSGGVSTPAVEGGALRVLMALRRVSCAG